MSNLVSPQQLYDYIVSKGVDHIHAMSILVNVKGESGFNAGIQERGVKHGRGGFGLFQHTGSRRRDLENFCEEIGKSVSDWQAQVDFAMTEPETKKYLSRKFSSIQAAAEWWCRYWERPANPDSDVRKRVAFIPDMVKAIQVA